MGAAGNEEGRIDAVIVGGGIGGSALATVLARNGLAVTVLEQQRTYADRVRGEYMAAWGVEIAQRLG
ncbi:MAG: FAD-dependent monooxygenase, partial [Chloroflexi bacterium]|nr:FAD-dependent monooxygenase [Chloroflexota bacterium]